MRLTYVGCSGVGIRRQTTLETFLRPMVWLRGSGGLPFRESMSCEHPSGCHHAEINADDARYNAADDIEQGSEHEVLTEKLKTLVTESRKGGSHRKTLLRATGVHGD